MLTGNPKIKVTKTDVARYLNDNSEKFPELIPLRDQYMERCNRARKIAVSKFGFWLQLNKQAIFNRIAKKLIKDPSILDDLYGSTATDA